MAIDQTTRKLFIIGFAGLALMIPLLMVMGLVQERQQLNDRTRQSIAQRWGHAQSLLPPLLSRIHAHPQTTQSGERTLRIEQKFTTPERVDAKLGLTAEERQLGIYSLPVYTARVHFEGRMAPQGRGVLETLRESSLQLLIPDLSALQAYPEVSIDGQAISTRPSVVSEQRHGGLAYALTPEQLRQGFHFSVSYRLNGSRYLGMVPLGGESRWQLEADWPHPEFIGGQLPVEREISESGFTAVWRDTGIGAPLSPAVWLERHPRGHTDIQRHGGQGFGVRLEQPMDLYRQNERSVKYGGLVILLTFLCLFLFEQIGGARLHLMHYLLTGAGLVLFYILLLALSEFIGFGPAYALAALVLIAMIAGYVRAVLASKRGGITIGGLLMLNYLLIYLLLSAEVFALLAGAIVLTVLLAVTMYLTRHINWAAPGRAPAP